MFRFLLVFLMFFALNSFANVGKVVAIKGEVSLIRDNKVSNLEKLFIILKDDEISTKNNSKVQLFFNDETIITIGEKSSFRVNDYLFDEKNKDVKAEFSMLKGTFKTITGKIGKIAPENFKLKTKSATIGIRGTQIQLDLSDNSEIISCTQGVITVTLLSSNKQIILKAGEALVVDVKSNEMKKVSNGNIVNVFSSESIKSFKIDKKHDQWLNEKNSITNSVVNAFSKGHKQEYNTTLLTGSIEEKIDGLSSFDTTNGSFNLSIDFGKNRNDNPVSGAVSIKTSTSISKTQKLVGNINNLNEIEMAYEVQVGGVFIKKDATGTLKFKNNKLDVEGKNIELRSYIDNEKIIIDKVQFKAIK